MWQERMKKKYRISEKKKKYGTSWWAVKENYLFLHT